MGIYTHNLKSMVHIPIMECPNFDVCHKKKDPRLKVCSPCFWRFKNEILEFGERECLVCCTTHKCVKFRKCAHLYVSNVLVKLYNVPRVLKDAGISLSNG
jgi:hypothetical protein